MPFRVAVDALVAGQVRAGAAGVASTAFSGGHLFQSLREAFEHPLRGLVLRDSSNDGLRWVAWADLYARAYPIADTGKHSLAHATHQITCVGALDCVQRIDPNCFQVARRGGARDASLDTRKDPSGNP